MRLSLVEMKSYWVRWALNTMIGVLIGKEQRGHTEPPTHREKVL